MEALRNDAERCFKMKFFARTGLVVSVLGALYACNGAAPATVSLGQDDAALVAAVAASEDGTEDATSPLGAEPFWVKGCGFGAIVSQVRERFDTDGSGDLSAEERSAIATEFGDPVDRVSLLLSLYDADDSGALDATELGALQSDIEARCESREAALLAQFDSDGDGKLSDAERDAARAALRARFGHGRHRGHGEGDAGVSDDDGRAFGESHRDRRERAQAHFDADGDGQLDGREHAAFGEHLRGCVRGEHPVVPGDDAAPDAGVE
jgi:EF hand domain-containing protein